MIHFILFHINLLKKSFRLPSYKLRIYLHIFNAGINKSNKFHSDKYYLCDLHFSLQV